jgi:hypothetical protein
VSSAGEVLGAGAMGDVIELGAGHDGRVLLLRFAVGWPAAGRLQRAYLVLDPMPQCLHRPGPIRIDVAHVLEPWRSAELSPGRPPRLDTPRRAGEIAATPPRPLRLDLTEVVQEWQQHRGRYHGLALTASGENASTACYTTGASWGRGPRLEIYLWPAEKDAGADADAGDAGTDARDAGKDAEAGS